MKEAGEENEPASEGSNGGTPSHDALQATINLFLYFQILALLSKPVHNCCSVVVDDFQLAVMISLSTICARLLRCWTR